jgi:dTDP-4-amino-4,6-dideoxygalactose transaminase
MEGIQGAVLRVKLRRLEKWNEARRKHAKLYNRLLANSGVLTPSVTPSNSHVWHIYAVRAKQRDYLQRTLQNHAIQTGIHYPIPVHLQKAYEDLGYRLGDFPCSEQIAREVLSLPMFPDLDEQALHTVAGCIKNGTCHEGL